MLVSVLARRGNTMLVLCAALALILSGCGTLSGALRAESTPVASQPTPSGDAPGSPVGPGARPAAEGGGGPAPGVATGPGVGGPPAGGVGGGRGLAQAGDTLAENDVDEVYDPWEPFNDKMFTVNRNLDRFVLKPAAKFYNLIMPEPFQILIANGFDNINFVPRFVNSVLQGKWSGAGRELARFVINSTAGVGGLFDPAKDYWGIQKSREDFGQTLGAWGSGAGPYLILPLLPPLTVRDGIGRAVDSLMDPLGYFLPFLWDGLGMKVGDTVNERALNIELFQGFEESVVDMYSAVRHGYLQRRERLIRE